jgi:hypothetical protein
MIFFVIMSENLRKLAINPLFYDALSGEFQPQCDTVPRSHTLGRLAVATFNKGRRLGPIRDDYIGNASEIKYSPSWAPRTTSKVIVQGASPRSDKLTGLHLEADPEGIVEHSFSAFEQEVLDDEGAHICLITNGHAQIIRVNLGNISEIQAHISSLANNEFFAKLPSPVSE